MTKVSKRPIRKEEENEMYEVLFASLAMVSSPKEIANFLNDILSPTEKMMIAKRLYIAVLLARGLTYELIEDSLKVSSPTIRGVNFAMKHGRQGYLNVINKIIRHEKVEAFLDRIEEAILKNYPRTGGRWEYEANRKVGREIFERKRKRLFVH